MSHLSIGQSQKKINKMAQKTLQKIGKDSSIHVFALDSIKVKVIQYSSISKKLNYTKIESHFTQSGSLLLMYVYKKDKSVFLIETMEKATFKRIYSRKNFFYYNKDGFLFDYFGRIGIQPHGISYDIIPIDNSFLKAQGYNPTLNQDFLIKYIKNLKKII